MPVRLELDPPPPVNSAQPGVTTSLLYSGSRFQGHQKSKGNCYDVEVILQVRLTPPPNCVDSCDTYLSVTLNSKEIALQGQCESLQ